MTATSPPPLKGFARGGQSVCIGCSYGFLVAVRRGWPVRPSAWIRMRSFLTRAIERFYGVVTTIDPFS